VIRLHESAVFRAWVALLVLLTLTPVSVVAQPAPPAGDPLSLLKDARESMKNGLYDQAIETLESVLGRPQQRTETMREAYLLLIKAFVYQGSDYASRGQKAQANLDFDKARDLVRECLQIPELRHTRPESEAEYPPREHELFRDVRAELFGSFRVSGVTPPSAVILFDADTLRAAAGESWRGDSDLLASKPHMVIVRSPGYRDFTEEVSLAPGETVERSYILHKPSHVAWYASGGALALAGTLVAAFAHKSGGATPEAPLGPPLDPPSHGRPQ